MAASYKTLEAQAKRQFRYRPLIENGEVIPRYLTAGVPYEDVTRTLERIGDADDAWCSEWSKTAAEHEEQAVIALRAKRYVTSGAAFYRAALCYHFAQYLHLIDLEQKSAAAARSFAAYRAGMQYFVPAAQSVEVPFESTTLPGFLRLVPGVKKNPCLIILGGADSTKQEYHILENNFLARGVATLSLDGPGQGEAWPRVKMRPDWEKAIGATLDHLARMPEIDAARIGILGLSFGGHLAVRSASLDDRLAACISLGGFYDTSHYDWSQPLRGIRFRYLCGTEDLDAAKRIASELDLSRVIARLKVPLLVVHGRRDRVSPPEHAERMYKDAPGQKELVMFEDGNHVCHNIPNKAHALIADWIAERFGAHVPGARPGGGLPV